MGQFKKDNAELSKKSLLQTKGSIYLNVSLFWEMENVVAGQEMPRVVDCQLVDEGMIFNAEELV